MPGKVKVRVLAARHLPVMDRGSENTDAFAEVRARKYVHARIYHTLISHT